MRTVFFKKTCLILNKPDSKHLWLINDSKQFIQYINIWCDSRNVFLGVYYNNNLTKRFIVITINRFVRF